MSESLPAAPALQAELDQLGLATTPWELQGALIGWIAGGGDADREWLRKVMADPALPELADGSAIGHFGRGTQAQIEDNDLGLTLLLPDEDTTLQARSAALFDWCRHFLGAFGLAAGAEPPLSDEELGIIWQFVTTIRTKFHFNLPLGFRAPFPVHIWRKMSG